MFEANQEETFSQKELGVLDFWKKYKVFEKSINQRKDHNFYTFYDGPPFATGLPHYGHLLAGTIKDVVPRYKTMKGFYVPRRFGWDCHGLPIENEIEKEKNLIGAHAIEEFGIANFNKECANIVLRYTSEWKKTVDRMGRWVDFSKTYRTMDQTFMESTWWVFSELYKKGLVYEGFKVMPFSTKLGTSLSNFEANLNYKEVQDPSLTMTFDVVGEKDTFFLVWTTTPWTLVSNLGIAVGADLDYVKLLYEGKYYILAEKRVSSYFKEKEYEIIEQMKGKDLYNKSYTPLFDFFKNHKNAFRVLLADFVSTEDGTGVVHMAPAFGEDDFYICKKENIEIVCPVNMNGLFTKEVPPYFGLYVKDADKVIIKDIKQKGKIFHHGQIHHRYPYCWRSDTPLIYKAVKTWFVAVEKIKEQLIAANKKIHWTPSHIKEGRFGKWLQNARDWNISRNRFWGTPIPIWRSEDGDIHVIESIKELEEKTKIKVEDLHRHHIDQLTFEKEGKTFYRIPEVFDCWFESGSMPYAQNHYPFENKDFIQKHFPADFIAEGLDQTRGWFYTLNVLSVALFNEPAFKNVIVNGIILAEDGNKMSKRLKNYPEPTLVIDQYGADAIRLYMLHSPAVKAEDLRFSKKGIELLLRQVLIPLWNAYYFLSTYAKIYDWRPDNIEEPKTDIDRWILSNTQKLLKEVETAMDSYDLSSAVDPFVGFIDQLTNWYIRRSRLRFWAEKDSSDRRSAFSTLYSVLLTLVKISAPFIPFLSEAIYQGLKTQDMLTSVHLCDYPKYQKQLRDEELEEQMHYVQRTVSIGHALRKEKKIKVRQPLKKVHLVATKEKIAKCLEKQKNLIADELNVKEVEILQDQKQFLTISIKPNFKVLGKKVGPLMPKIQKLMQQFSSSEIDQLQSGKMLDVAIDEIIVQLTQEDVIIDKQVKQNIAASHDEEIVVAYDTHLTEELLMEGLAREMVNKINTMRREEKLDVQDRIHVMIEGSKRLKECFDLHKSYICNEVLALSVKFESCVGKSWDLNGEEATIAIQKAT